MKFLSILIVGLVFLGGVWYFLMTRSMDTVSDLEPGTSMTEVEKGIEVTKTDITQAGISKLPTGFPSAIPVEAPNVTESYRTVYKERGVTQYTVSYTSLKSRDALWDIYNDYMRSANYTLDTSATSKSLGQISGTTANNDTLSIIISARSGFTLVQISFLDRS